MDPLQALESLLLSMFSADELRRFLRFLPDGDILIGSLPGPTASPVTVAHESVMALDKQRLFDDIFWARLVEQRPRRQAEIDKVRALFTQRAAAPAVAPTATSTAVASAPAPPSVLTILMASANPDPTKRLSVDKEFRQVINKLRGSKYRDRLNVVPILATRYEDLRTALLEHEPHVLHLSCHGEPGGVLKFEGDTGPQHIPKKNLQKLLIALSDKLRLVVFNACHSAELAHDLAPTIGLSIGMSDEILDTESIEFSVAFYETLAFGKSVQTAFDTALAGLSVDDIPTLYPVPDEDLAKKRRQPLITGAGA